MKNKNIKQIINVDRRNKKNLLSDYCKVCINDYDDSQMCNFCKKGSHQKLGQ